MQSFFAEAGGLEVWKAAVLGIVQGITEFLPVSSSGHLLLFERLLGAETGGADMFLGIMLHAGTLLAVCAACFPALVRLLRDKKRLLYLVLASVPAALVGFLLRGAVDDAFFGGDLLWAAFALTALLLAVCSARIGRGYAPRLLNAPRALGVGCAQALAVIPGLSRSGTTLAAGVFLGLKREEAAEFSLLMSVPVIAGAVLAEALGLVLGGTQAASVGWGSLAAGTLCAFAFGLVSVKLILRVMARGSLMPFAVYLIVLAAALLGARAVFGA